MSNISFKSKFSFFNKNDADKSYYSETSPRETINKNSTWFQTMEPITYAKNQTKKLYEIDYVNINEVDSKIFKDLLFFRHPKPYGGGRGCDPRPAGGEGGSTMFKLIYVFLSFWWGGSFFFEGISHHF